MMRGIRLLLGLLLLIGGGTVAARSFGSLPALGPLLDPAGGIWAVARSADRRDESVDLPGMSAAVEVQVDDRGVPHIFAQTELDGYRALGYLVARDRLFQLEIQSRAAAGTLSELVGAAALPLDRRARQLGFGRLVDRNLAEIDTADQVFRAIRAYGDGINAWLDGMTRADRPIESVWRGRPWHTLISGCRSPAGSSCWRWPSCA